MYLVGFQNRLVVFIQWAISYLTFNRKARLITGGVVLPELSSSRSRKAAEGIADVEEEPASASR
jgi:NADH dehydrogenase